MIEGVVDSGSCFTDSFTTMRFSVLYTALSATVANAAYSGDIVQYW